MSHAFAKRVKHDEELVKNNLEALLLRVNPVLFSVLAVLAVCVLILVVEH
jgi:hypothetical protein